MIEEDTVFILGAGANKPFGFPIGRNLKDEIYITLKENRNKILNGLATPNLIRCFIEKLSIAPEESIDAFLENETDQTIIDFGKNAIAAVLLPQEKEKYLFNNYRGSGNEDEYFNWYRFLWNQMKTSFDDFEHNLSIITFNYDRSLEHYLYRVLKQKNPGKEDDIYQKKLDCIPIIHVYGKLGFLPWECEEDKRPVPYNYDWDYITRSFNRIREQEILIENASQNINIIHEGDKVENAQQIKSLLISAKRILFLGFGFNPVNLKRLFGNIKRSDCEIKGTVYKMPLKSKKIAGEILKTFKNSDLWKFEDHFFDTTIYDFFNQRIII